MTVTVNGVIPEGTTSEIDTPIYTVQFNFMSFSVNAFNQAHNLNPDYGIGAATKFFAIEDCYAQSDIFQINFNTPGGSAEEIPAVPETYEEQMNLLGDIDGDGSVGTTDLLSLLANFGQNGDNLLGDFDGDVVYFGTGSSNVLGEIVHFKSDGTWEAADANASC